MTDPITTDVPRTTVVSTPVSALEAATPKDDPELVRRSHFRQVRRDALWRRVSIIALVAALLVFALVSCLLLTAARP